MITKELQEKAVHLKPIDRMHLVETLLESLDRLDPDIEKAWAIESETRYASYRKGKLKSISYKTLKRKLDK